MAIPKPSASPEPPPLAPAPALRVFLAEQREDEAKPPFSRPKSRWLVVLVVLSVLSLAIDTITIQSLQHLDLPGEVSKLVTYAEIFGHGVGVILLCLLAGLLDVRGMRVTGYLAVHAIGAGLIADGLKLFFTRLRPYHLLEPSAMDFAVKLPEFQWPTASVLTQAVRSFPSGHAATAAGLAIGLSRLYPKGTLLFALFAVLASTQRVVAGAHYPSDCAVGITCAFALSYMLYYPLRVHERWLGPVTLKS